MTTLYRLLAIVLSIGVFTSTIFADNCICPMFPMYQVPGGWFHAAAVFDLPPPGGTTCVFKYSTGEILPAPSPTRNCAGSPPCGDCQTLGPSAPTGSDLHFTGPLKTYTDLNDKDRFRDYISVGGTINYDDWDFDNSRVIQLSRTIGGTTKPFYAVIWRIVPKAPVTTAAFDGYVGFEISDATGATPVHYESLCVAADSRKVSGVLTHTPIPGLLQVQFDSTMAVAFIRLSKDTNSDATFPICRQTVSPTPAASSCASVSCATCQSSTACLPSVTCKPCEYRCPRRSRAMRRCLGW